MPIPNKEMNSTVDRASDAIGQILLAATDTTDDAKQRFVMACQIAAHVFGMTGAMFQRLPGHEASDRKEASDAVLQVVAGYAIKQH